MSRRFGNPCSPYTDLLRLHSEKTDLSVKLLTG